MESNGQTKGEWVEGISRDRNEGMVHNEKTDIGEEHASGR